MTITDKLEGLLPADGKPMTRNDRVIAEAVRELMITEVDRDNWRSSAAHYRDRWLRAQQANTWAFPLAFIAGLIAGALFGGWG